MATELPTKENGTSHTQTNGETPKNQQTVKEGLARMLKGGVIMDVVNAEQVIPMCEDTRLTYHAICEQLLMFAVRLA
jgi:hypothetical protein